MAARPSRITPGTLRRLHAEGDFLGDYLAITAFGNKVYGAWAHQTTEEAKTERGKRTRTILRVRQRGF